MVFHFLVRQAYSKITGMAIMTKKINRNEGLKRIIETMEFWKKQQEALTLTYPKYSLDGAMANARAQTLSLSLDRAKTYLTGGPHADKVFKELKRKS